MTRGGPWIPPTANGLARWHRLHRDAVNLLAKPMNGGGELARSAMAVRGDTFPSQDPEHWKVFDSWMKAARKYAAATPLERQTDAATFTDLTRWAGIAMGLDTAPPPAAAPPEPAPRFRRDIDG